MKKNFSKIFSALNTGKNGFIVGSTMLVPGVSGGTMALILGIYDKLLHAVNNIFKEFKKSFFFLLEFCVGAALGFLIFARVITFLLEKFQLPIRYIFVGAVLGGIPLLLKKSQVRFNKIGDVLIGVFSFLIGAVIVFSLEFIPANAFEFGGTFSLQSILLQLLAGIVIAIALILPGISTSHMLIVLGLYYFITEEVLRNPFNHLVFIICLVVFTLIGTFLTTNILEKTMTKFPKATYFAIIGFITGSLKEIIIGTTEMGESYYIFPVGFEYVVAVLAIALGFSATYYLSKREKA